MSKSGLVDAISGDFGSKREAERAIERVTGGIVAMMQRGERVTLPGFGTFKVKQREERAGRNPRTGESIRIAARRVASFEGRFDL